MYKKTPPQGKLFGIETRISRSLRSRLESSWAHLFRCEILPILFRKEDDYASLYGTTGRPNFSVARLLGLSLLQEWNDLSDQEALDTYSFDARWRYALDVHEEDYLSVGDVVDQRDKLPFSPQSLLLSLSPICPLSSNSIRISIEKISGHALW